MPKTTQKNPILEALAALDRGDLEYWKRLEEADRKKISSFVLVQWLSAYCDSEVDWNEARRQGRAKGDGKGQWPQRMSDNDATVNFILLVNEIINPDFWTIIQRPDVAWRLMAYCGRTVKDLGHKPGRNSQHVWLNPGKTSTTPKLDELLKKLHPLASIDEIHIVRNELSPLDVKEICQDFGLEDPDIKKYTDEFREHLKAIEEEEDDNGTL